MNKGEGAQLALRAAENYQQQSQMIEQCRAGWEADLAPILAQFEQQASLLIDRLMTTEAEWPALAMSLQAPLLLRWLDLLEPFALELSSRLSEWEHSLQAMQTQADFPRLQTLANWLSLQQQLSEFDSQTYFQTLFQAWSLGQKPPLLCRAGCFLLGLIGRNPRQAIPRNLGKTDLVACFTQYAALQQGLQDPAVQPPAADQTDTRRQAEARVYLEQRPLCERLSAFYAPAVRQDRVRRLFVAGLLATLFHPDGHVLAAARLTGLEAAMLKLSDETFARDLQQLIQLLLKPEHFHPREYQRLVQTLFDTGPLRQAGHQQAHDLYQQQEIGELYRALEKRVPFDELARFQALCQQLGYLNQIGVFLAEQQKDRLLRMHKMQRIAGVWRRNPHDRLRDKNKWLVEVPEIKARALARQVELCQRLHRVLCDFHDYQGYADILRSGQPLVPFDAFVCHARKDIPHEGFNQLVISGLSHARQAQGQERPDYRRLEKSFSRTRASGFHTSHSGFHAPHLEEILLPVDPVYPDEGEMAQDEVYADFDNMASGDNLAAEPDSQSDGGVLEALVAEGVSDGLSEDLS